MPTALAWFFADFSQKQGAFDLTQGRHQMREIVSKYFVGASFFRTTGLYERALSGGLATMVFGIMPPDSREAARALVQFKERVRACAKHLAVFFEQDSVAAVVQEPSGHISVGFIGKTDYVDFRRFLDERDLARIQRMKRNETKRLEEKTIYGD